MDRANTIVSVLSGLFLLMINTCFMVCNKKRTRQDAVASCVCVFFMMTFDFILLLQSEDNMIFETEDIWIVWNCVQLSAIFFTLTSHYFLWRRNQERAHWFIRAPFMAIFTFTCFLTVNWFASTSIEWNQLQVISQIQVNIISLSSALLIVGSSSS